MGGSSVCEGIAEVRQGSQWAALCDSSVARGRARWEELCQEQQCGNLLSIHALDADRTTPGLICTQEKLSRCYQLQKRNTCKRVFVTCELTAALGGWRTVRGFSSRTWSGSTSLEDRSERQIKGPGKGTVNGVLGATISGTGEAQADHCQAPSRSQNSFFPSSSCSPGCKLESQGMDGTDLLHEWQLNNG